ncbi:hypothetical protein ACJ41O_011977 [Fusarium nematophilum]
MSEGLLSPRGRQKLRDELLSANDTLISRIPKVELHIHIEGTLTPELRWKLAKRNNLEIRMSKDSDVINSLGGLKEAYQSIISSSQLHRYREHSPSDIPITFFEAYYAGLDVLRTRRDFYDLAMNYFHHAAAMNVRYCEPFFDPQAHTRRGIALHDMMAGFRDAQEEASRELNVQSSWIMCILRDLPPDSAMDHFQAALPYRDMIVGIGLDSNEYNRPPILFQEIFQMAKRDGFKVTAHCDVGQKDTHEHIRQVASPTDGIGAHRIDHGLNAAEQPELIELILKREVSMTICPWAYLRREAFDSIGHRLRALVDAGIKICISSDDPPYMDDAWITHNMLLTRRICDLSDDEVVSMVKNAVEMSWAEEHVKQAILEEIYAM